LGFGEVERERRLAWQAAENIRQRQGWRLGKYQRAGEMDQGADRAAVARAIVSARRIAGRVVRVTRRIRADGREFTGGEAVEMHMPEGQRELEYEREQRKVRTQTRTRPEPVHCRCAIVRLKPCRRTIPPAWLRNLVIL
jgi:hypothetical protein